MAGVKQILDFLKQRVGNLGIPSLVVIVLEMMMDNDFVCPCQPGYNEWICACYALVPLFTSFVFTLCFVKPTPEDDELEGNSTCRKWIQPTLIALIWLLFFFLDGQYMACGCSHWDGEYTVTGSLKWCKPIKNETLLEHLQETQRYITRSQFAGFGIAVIITFILAVSCSC